MPNRLNFIHAKLLFIGMLIPFISLGQNSEKIETLVMKALTKEPSAMFIHFDKTIYVPNESIYFSAYFITNNVHLDIGPILHIALVKRDNQTVYAYKNYIVEELTSSGSLIIPDSIPEGNYTLLAFNNMLVGNEPNHTFKQHIFIKDPSKPSTVPIAKNLQQNGLTESNTTKVELKFYPEGGVLVDGIQSLVGFEARDETGKPQAIQGILYENNIAIDTIHTSNFGMGKFLLKPDINKSYYAQLISAPADAKFPLPNIQKKGIGLQLAQATPTDTLKFRVNTQVPQKISIVLHNVQNAFYINYNTTVNETYNFNIPLNSVPKGLTTLTVFNEQAEPVSERMFYAHYASKSTVLIKSDQSEYAQRSPIKLELGLQSGGDTSAVVSVAVVQLNRVDRRNFQQIDNYGYIMQDIEYLPINFLIETEAKKREYIEDLLLVKGWRKYADHKPSEMIPNPTGYVLRNKKALKKAINLTLIGSEGMSFIPTEETGKFDLNWEEMGVGFNKKLKLFALGEDAQYTKIFVEDHSQPYLKKLVFSNVTAPPLNILKYEVPKLEQLFFQSQIAIEEVVISRSNTDQFRRFLPWKATNKCGDYICENDILNCPNHRGGIRNSAPVVGKVYYIPGITWSMSTYLGCDEPKVSTIDLEGVNFIRELYTYTHHDLESSSPMYHSTIYWQSDLKLIAGKPQEISFFTGDIYGNFTVILQGITDNSVIYSEKGFSIKK